MLRSGDRLSRIGGRARTRGRAKAPSFPYWSSRSAPLRSTTLSPEGEPQQKRLAIQKKKKHHHHPRHLCSVYGRKERTPLQEKRKRPAARGMDERTWASQAATNPVRARSPRVFSSVSELLLTTAGEPGLHLPHAFMLKWPSPACMLVMWLIFDAGSTGGQNGKRERWW